MKNVSIQSSLSILTALGVPLINGSKRRNERTAKAFIALCGLTFKSKWKDVKSLKDGHALLSRDVIRYMNLHLGEDISESSYDDIRRKDLALPVQAGIILKAATKTNASTNDGTRKYALADNAALVIKEYGSDRWEDVLNDYLKSHKALSEALDKEREMALIPVKVAEGKSLYLSHGEHNEIQKQIIEEFLPRFGFNAELLYLGDTAKKLLYLNKEKLESLGVFELSHDKLPDVIAYSESKNWLFLIEAVHSANPITELRKLTLDELTKDIRAGIIYVSAFREKVTFRKFAKDIAWETEVWISESPSHMIHFNGDKFLGPHKS